MNTPAHLLIGVAIFGRPATSPIIDAAMIGAILPDLSVYPMAGISLILLKIPSETVFGELYYSDQWRMVFAIKLVLDLDRAAWGRSLAVYARKRQKRQDFWVA